MNAATITRAEWESFAEATFEHRSEARNVGRHITAATPPVALARRARHRKPNSGKWRTAVKVAGAAFLFGAITTATLTGAAPRHAQPYAGLTPQQVSSVATDLAPDTTP